MVKMMEKFNQNLNQNNQNRFDNWIDYREKIEHFLIPHLSKKLNKSLIVGAGNLDDIPLSMFVKALSSVTITDISYQSMENGLNHFKLNKAEKEKIKCIAFEYTGLDKLHFFENLNDLLNKNKSIVDIKKYIEKNFNDINNHSWCDALSETYDFIYVSPIYTQLIYFQAFELIRHYPNYQDLNGYLLNQMISIIDHFNDNLLKVGHKNTVICVLSDIFEMNNQSTFYEEVRMAINQPKTMDAVYQAYQKKYGFGLGDYGLFSLKQKVKTIEEHWVLWPFSQEKSMAVKMFFCKVG